jgi:hypothetical protein
VGNITVSETVMSTLEELAVARKTDVYGVLAEAIGLEVALVQAQRNGSRMLIERHGQVEELVPPQLSWQV